jgi:hypothetical protein
MHLRVPNIHTPRAPYANAGALSLAWALSVPTSCPFWLCPMCALACVHACACAQAFLCVRARAREHACVCVCLRARAYLCAMCMVIWMPWHSRYSRYTSMCMVIWMPWHRARHRCSAIGHVALASPCTISPQPSSTMFVQRWHPEPCALYAPTTEP